MKNLQKNMTVLLLIFFIFISFLPIQTFASENIFIDVDEEDYYYNAVLWAYDNGITNGYGNSYTFNPDRICTRGEIVTFLWRFSGKTDSKSKDNPFIDVEKGKFYYDAVLWASEVGITNGYGHPNTFCPDRYCTRGEIVTFLWRLYNSPIYNNQTNFFDDIYIDKYYYNSVLWAYNNRIAIGNGQNKFAPDDECTRAQVVTFIWRSWWANKIEEDNMLCNAIEYGLSESNTGKENSIILQKLIDDLSGLGGTIYIPAGEYEFAKNGEQTIGWHCIKMRSNINIVGEGNNTILKPIGGSYEGLDMFYFNDYIDIGEPVYLENCKFENFVIDAINTSCEHYSTAGKGFMFNLFKNCHWDSVIVKNTDATGFGVDCPIDSSMINCTAIGCGKAATITNEGASGFGIGFGYSENESMLISNCISDGNTKFGFFFEHQGRFNKNLYNSTISKGFIVENCKASYNLYNFGGINAFDLIYQNCNSICAIDYGFYFINSQDFKIINCYDNECEAEIYSTNII